MAETPESYENRAQFASLNPTYRELVELRKAAAEAGEPTEPPVEPLPIDDGTDLFDDEEESDDE